MKRSWTITLLICLLLLGAGAAAILLPRVVPYSQCSDIYKKYARTDGIEAAFVKDYRINDTLTLPVTLLEAKDTNIWEELCKDFGITTVSMYPKEYKPLIVHADCFLQYIIIDTITTEQYISYRRNLIIFSHFHMSIYIFQDIDEHIYNAIIDKKIKEISH